MRQEVSSPLQDAEIFLTDVENSRKRKGVAGVWPNLPRNALRRAEIYPNGKFGSIAVKVLIAILRSSFFKIAIASFFALFLQGCLAGSAETVPSVRQFLPNVRDRNFVSNRTSWQRTALFLPEGSLLPEKLLQNRLAVFGHHASHDGRLMIQANIGGQAEERMAGPGFRIRCPVDHSGNSSLHDGAGAHGTGFECDIQSAVQQSPRLQNLSRLRDRDHFCMRRGIIQCLTLIAASAMTRS
jgi:hypothetical protein